MAAEGQMADTEREGPSRQVLAETPGRVLKFLGAAGKSLGIRAILRKHGYSDEDHREGWELLHEVTGFTEAEPPEVEDAAVASATTELDAWDEPNFRMARAALERRHPEQAKFVFLELEPQAGPGAVISVKKLLDRLDALEKATERKKTRKEDHAALETLAKRGMTKEERDRLRELVHIAMAANAGEAEAEDEAGSADPKGPVVDSEEHVGTLLALHGWYREWSETARATIKRRDYLIRLGLAHRKKPRKPEPPK
jgi:hypothetical protein